MTQFKRFGCFALAATMICGSMIATPAMAAKVSRGGYSIDSHNSGRTYSRSSIRYAYGKAKASRRYLAESGRANSRGTVIWESHVIGRASFRGRWAGGPRGWVSTNSSLRNEHLLILIGEYGGYAYVTGFDVR